jgi:hypothetical protein
MNNNMLKMIFVNDLVIEKIKLFVNLILYTGYIPKTLNTSIIIPIIKDKSMNQFDKNNYRPISVSNVLAQILEKVILVNCPIINNSSTVQFGFKNLMSTIHPLFLLKEAIHKYKLEEKPLYIASLDSEKAYDSVWRDGMFFKLIDVITNQFWHIARAYYNQSTGYFKIDGIVDKKVIKINRGVKQGGVLSPQLFNFFINELLEILKNSGMGIRCGNTNLPIMGYCDDTQLLANLICELQRMIDICVDYSKKWLMKYNIKKSMIMNIGYQMIKNEDIKIKINDRVLPVVSECKYLGLKITEKNEDDNYLVEKFRNIQRCVYSLNSYGLKPTGVNPRVKSFIYNTYCQPVGSYGIGLINVKKKTINQVNIVQNNLIRYMLDIPYKSHISNLLRVLKIVDVETLIDINKCTIIKLLHRDKLSKDILIDNINAKNEDWWLYRDIKKISEQLGIEIERVCYYPDITRKMILEKYYEANQIENEIREEMDQLLKDYSFKNKKKLKDLVKITWSDE